jgi:hypothetical protein
VGLLVGWILGKILSSPGNVWCAHALDEVFAFTMRLICPSPRGSIQDTPQARWLVSIFRSLTSAASGFTIMYLLAERLPSHLETERDKRASGEVGSETSGDRTVEILSCLCCLAAMTVVITVRGRQMTKSTSTTPNDRQGRNRYTSSSSPAPNESSWLLSSALEETAGVRKATQACNTADSSDDDSFLV